MALRDHPVLVQWLWVVLGGRESGSVSPGVPKPARCCWRKMQALAGHTQVLAMALNDPGFPAVTCSSTKRGRAGELLAAWRGHAGGRCSQISREGGGRGEIKDWELWGKIAGRAWFYIALCLEPTSPAPGMQQAGARPPHHEIVKRISSGGFLPLTVRFLSLPGPRSRTFLCSPQGQKLPAQFVFRSQAQLRMWAGRRGLGLCKRPRQAVVQPLTPA